MTDESENIEDESVSEDEKPQLEDTIFDDSSPKSVEMVADEPERKKRKFLTPLEILALFAMVAVTAAMLVPLWQEMK